MSRKKLALTVYVDADQKARLDALRERGVPTAELVRRALNGVLDAYDGDHEEILNKAAVAANAAIEDPVMRQIGNELLNVIFYARDVRELAERYGTRVQRITERIFRAREALDDALK